jgi:hypothetical protein
MIIRGVNFFVNTVAVIGSALISSTTEFQEMASEANDKPRITGWTI